MERFDICEVINSYLQSAGKLAKEAGCDVLAENNVSHYVWGDPYMAETVFANYFTNAVHHCTEVNRSKNIRISYENRGKILKVSVFNTGEHIPEESLPRIWDKFYKVDKARTREYGGSGVGLSIVKAIQNSIGMDYGAENVEGGVVFWFEMEAK